jgi:hypothetical protein
VAEVESGTLFLHKGDELETYLTFPSFTIKPTRTKRGAVRMMAGGRRRSVSRPGTWTEVDVSLEWITTAERETVESWLEELVLLRDPRGRNVWGRYFSTSDDEHPPTEFVTVSFRLEELTIDEAV